MCACAFFNNFLFVTNSVLAMSAMIRFPSVEFLISGRFVEKLKNEFRTHVKYFHTNGI